MRRLDGKPRAPKKLKPGNKDGRPLIDVDLKKVKFFCRFNPTDVELAYALDLSPRTFTNKKAENPAIAEAMEAGRALGRISLRGKQYDKAMKGDNTMLIWLGKQTLDQKEKTQIGSDPEHPFPMTFVPDLTRPPSADDKVS